MKPRRRFIWWRKVRKAKIADEEKDVCASYGESTIAQLASRIGTPEQDLAKISWSTAREWLTERGDENHNSAATGRAIEILIVVLIGFEIALSIYGIHDSRRIAADSERTTREYFRLDNRASIGIERMETKGAVPQARAVLYEATARNFGKTVARDISFKKASFLDANTDEAIIRRAIKNGQDRLKDQRSVSFPNSLGPNAPVVIPFSVGGSTPQTYGKGPKSETWRDYLIGRFEYNSFGVPHWITFCFVIQDASGNIGYCDTGNDEDTNSELPN